MVGTRIGSVVCPVLVGRDEALQLVGSRFEEVAAGRGQLILIAGDPGIGKSRFLGSIERRAAGSGFRTAIGALAPQDTDVPGALLLDLARRMRSRPETAAVGRSLLAQLADAEVDMPLEPGRRRRLLVLDAVDLLAEVDAPMFIGLEDLQWADDLSLEIVAALARRLGDVPIVVAATFRNDELRRSKDLAAWRARLLLHRQAEEIRLGPLDRSGTRTMLHLLLGDARVSDELVTAVHDRADGIPLHVEELAAVLVSEPSGGAAEVRAASVPDTVEAVILERFLQRSDDARDLASTGAVLGRRFPLELVARLMDRPSDDLEDPLRELVDHAFLEAAGAPETFDFRHQLLRDTIYERIPAAERRRLHGLAGRLAAGVEGSFAVDASAHFELAGMDEEAFAAALAGARAAGQISAHREAMGLYRRAIRHLPPDLGPAQRAQILEALASEEAARDEAVEAAANLELARDAYREAGDDIAAAAVLAELAAVRHLIGDGLAAVRPLLDEGLAVLGAAEGSAADRVRGRLEAELGAAYSRAVLVNEGELHARRAVAIARQVGDVSTELHGLGTLATILPFAGRTDEAIEAAVEVLERGREAREEDQVARACRVVGSTLTEVFEAEIGDTWLRDGIEIAERADLWNHRCYMLAHHGFALWALGSWDEAERAANEALRDRHGGVTTRITGLYVLGYVAFSRGQDELAREHLEASLSLGERAGDLIRTALPAWGLAETAYLAGRHAEAIERSERGRASSAAVGDVFLFAPFLLTGLRSLLAKRDVQGAERWLSDAGASLRDTGHPTLAPVLDHADGLLALARGSTGLARSRLAAAVRGWDRQRRIWEATWARLDLAAALLRVRRADEASDMLTDARTTADQLGSRPLVARSVELLRLARSRRGPREPWAPLTAREFAVARLVADGHTNAEIAVELEISPRTVSAHVEHILAKLGVNRRSEIAAWAVGIGAGGAVPSDPR
jgi:DNA-binding CsgD family transcriptional regulator